MNLAERIQQLYDWSLDDEDDRAGLPPEHLYVCGETGNRAALDAFFSKLTITPDYSDEGEFAGLCYVRDSNGNVLGRWPQDRIGEVLQGLLKLQSICPGGATYVMLNNDSIIHQWRLNVQHFSAKMRGKRIDDLPNMAGARSKSSKQELTAGLLSELLQGGKE